MSRKSYLGAKERSVRRSVWMSHGTHMNEICHTYVDDIYVCDTYEWVMSHTSWWRLCVYVCDTYDI